MKHTLSERVTMRLQEMAHQRGFGKRLAARLRVSQGAISPYVAGTREVSLDMLEAMSEETGVPLAELVAPPDAVLKQLDAEEAALLRAVRNWPKDVMWNLLRFVLFFENADPVSAQSRNMHEVFRRLKPQERDWIYGLAVGLREGALQPDIQEGLAVHVAGEARAVRLLLDRRMKRERRKT